jgi:hypothetical protein
LWSIGWPQNAEETERLAEEERLSRSTDTWVVLACIASLVAVVAAVGSRAAVRTPLPWPLSC